MVVLRQDLPFPPSFAHSSVVLAQFEEMAEDGNRSWDFGDSGDVGNIC